MCDETSACNQLSSLPLLNDTSAGTGSLCPSGRKSFSYIQPWGRYAYLGAPDPVIGQTKIIPAGLMHTQQPQNDDVK